MKDGSLVLTMEKGAPVYGLGEQVRGINKRGWLYTSNCTMIPTTWRPPTPSTEHTTSFS